MKECVRRGASQRQVYWEEVMRRWRESAQSVRGFCRDEGLQESAFYCWRRKLARRSQRTDAGNGARPQARPVTRAATSPGRVSSPPGSGPSFLPVQVIGSVSGHPASAGAANGVEINLGQGRTVRVRAGFDRQTLVEVLAVLEARPC
jgi:hypothetical protein